MGSLVGLWSMPLRRIISVTTGFYTAAFIKYEIKGEKDMSANAPEPTTTTWNIDPIHTTVEFKVRHMMISNVKGHFTGVTGVLTLDKQDITKSHVEASIDAATINTRDADRDTHLKSADFL